MRNAWHPQSFPLRSGLRCIRIYVSSPAIMRLFLFALVALTAFWQSQPPFPATAKPNQTNQDKAPKQDEGNTNNNSSQASSPAINQQPAPVVTIQNEQNCCSPREHGASADWWARASTILLTLFTGALALLAYKQWGALDDQHKAMREQAQYMRKGLRISLIAARTAKRSADAAKLSAESLRQAERARILLELRSSYVGIHEVWMVNNGRTPAHAISQKIGEGIVPVGIPDLDPRTITEVQVLLNYTLAPGESKHLETLDVLRFRNQMGAKEGEVYVASASIVYRDVFGVEHKSKSVYSWSSNRKSLQRVPRYTEND
jgi:hypothetical protein